MSLLSSSSAHGILLDMLELEWEKTQMMQSRNQCLEGWYSPSHRLCNRSTDEFLQPRAPPAQKPKLYLRLTHEFLQLPCMSVCVRLCVCTKNKFQRDYLILFEHTNCKLVKTEHVHDANMSKSTPKEIRPLQQYEQLS